MGKRIRCEYCEQIFNQDDMDGAMMCPQCFQPIENIIYIDKDDFDQDQDQDCKQNQQQLYYNPLMYQDDNGYDYNSKKNQDQDQYENDQTNQYDEDQDQDQCEEYDEEYEEDDYF